jgi:hypothetical protein
MRADEVVAPRRYRGAAAVRAVASAQTYRDTALGSDVMQAALEGDALLRSSGSLRNALSIRFAGRRRIAVACSDSIGPHRRHFRRRH